MTIKRMYRAVKRIAQHSAQEDEEIILGEVCDFGDAYGFAFVQKDKYSNVYWCVTKKDARIYTYRPNQDIKKFVRRKILKNAMLED